MDPINPIIPGASSSLPSIGPPPVERLPRVSRERDRPRRDSPGPRRPPPAPEEEPDPPEDEDGRPRVDIRV